MSDQSSRVLNLDAVEQVLIVAVPCIGDTLLATPVASSLLAQKPDLQIDFLVQEGCSALLADCSGVRHIIEYDYRSAVGSYVRMYSRLFRRYDLAISTSASDRSIQAAICAAGRRYGLVPPFSWNSAWKHWALIRPIVRDDFLPVTELNMRLVDQMGLPRVGDFLLPELGPDSPPSEKDALENRRLPYAVIHGTPRQAYKEWPLESWVEVAENLHARGLHVYVSGGPAEADARFARDLCARFDEGVTSLAGQLGFGALTRLLRESEVYVGVDTVTSHIAAATGIPVVVLFGPTNHRKWGPVAKAGASGEFFDQPSGVRAIGNVTLCKADCRCTNFEECQQHSDPQALCLQQLRPADVIAAMDETMRCSRGRRRHFKNIPGSSAPAGNPARLPARTQP